MWLAGPLSQAAMVLARLPWVEVALQQDACHSLLLLEANPLFPQLLRGEGLGTGRVQLP